MSLVVELNFLALLILNLSLMAWIKLRWPDSSVGKILAVIS